MTNNDGCTVLGPKGGLRGKPHKLLKGGKVVAEVHLGFTPWAGDYVHPCLTLKALYKSEDGSTYDKTLLNVIFQRTNMARAGAVDPVGGFLSDPSGKEWSGAYAGRVDGQLTERHYLEIGLGFLDRASEAIKQQSTLMRALSAANCQLLTLISGLQHIGIEVTILGGGRNKASTETMQEAVAA